MVLHSTIVDGMAFQHLWVIGMGVISVSIKMLKIKHKLRPNIPLPHAFAKPSNFFLSPIEFKSPMHLVLLFKNLMV